jgi:hypothetical protein
MKQEPVLLCGGRVEFDGRRLRLFTISGYTKSDGTIMFKGDGPGMLGFAYLPQDPEGSTMDEVLKLIEADITNGNLDKIHFVYLSAIHAVHFWMEGHLTPEHILGARYITGRIVGMDAVTFQTSVGSREFHILVESSPEEFNMATFTKEGEVV